MMSEPVNYFMTEIPNNNMSGRSYAISFCKNAAVTYVFKWVNYIVLVKVCTKLNRFSSQLFQSRSQFGLKYSAFDSNLQTRCHPVVDADHSRTVAQHSTNCGLTGNGLNQIWASIEVCVVQCGA